MPAYHKWPIRTNVIPYCHSAPPYLWYLPLMKTNVEISDSLYRQAKQYAARHSIPLREVFERGLTSVLQDAAPARRRFRLKTITTKGEGLGCNGDWATVRSLIYEGRGG